MAKMVELAVQISSDSKAASVPVGSGKRIQTLVISFSSKPLLSQFTALVFRNFYTASFRMELHSTQGEMFVLADQYNLMKHLHCEDDAQKWHIVHMQKFWDTIPTAIVIDRVVLVLSQPSPLWDKFELQQIKCYQQDNDKSCVGAPNTSSCSSSLSLSPQRTGWTSQASSSVKSFSPASSSSTTTTTTTSNTTTKLSRRFSKSSLTAAFDEAQDTYDNTKRMLQTIHHLRALVKANEL